MTVTVDSTAHSADATWPSADGYLPTNIIFAEVFEPVRAGVSADSTAYTADNTIWPTADGGVSTGALESVDAIRVPAIAAGAGFWVDRMSRPRRVVGVGYGILPELVGEAHGIVYTGGVGAASVSIAGAAVGEHHDDELELLALMLLLAA